MQQHLPSEVQQEATSEWLPADATLSPKHRPLETSEQEALLARLQAQSRRQRRWHRTLMTLYFVGCSLAILFSLAYWARIIKPSPWTGFLYLGYFISIVTAKAVAKKWRQTAERMAEFDDVRVVGTLVHAMEWDTGQETARNALVRLLPRLRASDAALLDDSQRDILNRILDSDPWSRSRQHAPLILPLLKALEQVGDSRFLPTLEKLVSWGGWGGTDHRIQAAAQECLSALNTRAEQERNSQSLLRAASALDLPNDQLLRAAQGVSQADPQTLLRPDAGTERG